MGLTGHNRTRRNNQKRMLGEADERRRLGPMLMVNLLSILYAESESKVLNVLSAGGKEREISSLLERGADSEKKKSLTMKAAPAPSPRQNDFDSRKKREGNKNE